MAQPSNMYDVFRGELGAALADSTTAKTLAKDDFRNALKATAAAPIAIPIALVDGTGQALEGLKNFVVADKLGFKQMESDVFSDTAASTLIEKVGLGGFADLYQKNRGAYQVSGDIVTLFTGAGAVRAGVRQGSKKVSDVGKLKVKGESLAGTLTNIATLPTRATMVPYNAAVRNFAASNAGKKVFGDYSVVSKQVDELDNIAMNVVKGEKQLTDLRASRKYTNAVGKLQQSGFAQSAREAAATEALITASLHDSDFIFPEGMTPMDHAFWGAVGIALPTGIDQLVLNAGIRKTAARAGQAVAEERSIAGYFATADNSSTFLMNARIANTAKNAEGTLTAEALANNDVQKLQAQKAIRRSTERLGAATPIESFVEFKPSKAQEKMIANIATENPEMFRGVTSFNDLPTGTLEGLGLDGKRNSLIEELVDLGNLKEPKQDQLLRMDNVQRQIDEIDTTTVHGIDVDGTAFAIGQKADTVYDDVINIKRDGDGFRNVLGNSRTDVLTPTGQFKRRVKETHMATLKDVTNSYALMPAAKGDFVESLRTAVVGRDVAKTDELLNAVASNLGKGDKIGYLETDYALEILTAIRDEPLLKNAGIELSAKFATGSLDNLIEAVETAGLQKKFNDLKKFAALKRSKGVEIRPLDLSRRYNLNMHYKDADVPTAVYDVMMQQLQRGGNFSSYGAFKAQVDTLAASRTAANVDEIDVAIKGNNLDIDLATQPMVYTVNDNTRGLQENMALTAAAEVLHLEKIDKTLDGLKYFDNMDEGIFAGVYQRIEDSGLRDSIRDVVRNIVGGQEGQAATRNGRGQVAAGVNSVVPQDRQFRNRNVQGFALVDATIDGVYKQEQKRITERLFEPFKEDYRKFRHTRQGKADQLSMGLYLNARGVGFDIDLKASDGFGKTMLQATTKNIDLLSNFLGKEKASQLFKSGAIALPDVTKLRQGIYQPVHVTEGAKRIMDVTNSIYKNVMDNHNTLRFGNGQEVVETHGLMLPPAFNANKEAAVVLARGSNEIVEVVFGQTRQKALDAAKKFAKEDMHYVASREEVEQILPHRLNNTLAEKSYNTAGSVSVDGQVTLDNMNRWLTDSSNNAIKSSVNRIFEPEMNFLAQQQKLQETLAPDAIGGRKQVSVYETMRNVFLNNRDEATGNIVIQAQDKVDKMLDAGVTLLSNGLDKSADVLRGGDKIKGSVLERFAEEAGYRPTQDAFEKAGLKLPKESQTVARKLNGLAGFFALRFFEPAQALLNVASLPTVLPALQSQLGYRAGEAIEDYRKRVGGFSDLIGAGNLNAAPSPLKGLINATHLYASGQGTEILKEAQELGNMFAPAVELQEVVFSRGRVLDNKTFKRVEELVTKPTDWTELFSRKLGYLQGYDMMRRMAPDMTKMELHTVANAYANRAVGDYRTVNKPQQFNGAVGSMMGLFQTFFINYWQRGTDMLETGNKRGLATLYATQASMFGLESVPGYDVYNQMWSNYDGSVAPTDLFAESFGTETAEVMLTGGLSNLPKLFGQDGIALYSRGDTNVRNIPNVTNALQVPALNMLGKVGKGVAEYGATARALGEMPSSMRSMEILAGSVPNRPVAGIMELINGHAVNRSGDLTVKDTRDSASRIVARLMGAKTIEEERTASTMWRQKLQQRKVQAHVNVIRRDFAARIRSNNGQITVKMLDDFHAKHYEKLQNPDTFDTWIGNLYKKSVDEKASSEMLMIYKRLAKGASGGYGDMQMRRLTQLLIANKSAMDGAVEIANR